MTARMMDVHSFARSRPFRLPLLACLGVLASCAGKPKDPLIAPQSLISPYRSSSDVLWAIAPLANESGVSLAESSRLSDQLVAATEEVQGITCLPLNRTLAAMSSMNMATVRSPGDARRLATVLGVDGVLVGSVTAYDPYTPTIGMTLSLYAGPGLARRSTLNPRDVASSPTESLGDTTIWRDDAITSVSHQFDAKNHQVQMDMARFAEGRSHGPHALGWKRYMASSMLYGEFVSYRMIEEILKREWVRVGAAPVVRAEE